MTRPRVLIADDHKMIIEGLRPVLESEFDLICTVEDGRALLDVVKKENPDVIVTDISMPMLNGIEAVRKIRETNSNVKVVFLTMHADVTYAAEAFEVGASGYVLKHSAPGELVTAIKEVLKGHTYVTPLILEDFMEICRDGSYKRNEALLKLSTRQREVLQLLAEGRSAKEVAEILNISARTVEFHKYKIMKELGIKTSAELVQYAVKHGIVSI